MEVVADVWPAVVMEDVSARGLAVGLTQAGVGVVGPHCLCKFCRVGHFCNASDTVPVFVNIVIPFWSNESRVRICQEVLETTNALGDLGMTHRGMFNLAKPEPFTLTCVEADVACIIQDIDIFVGYLLGFSDRH